MSARKRPELDLDRTVERLERVGLSHAALALGDRLSEAIKGEWPPHGFLDRMLDEALNLREDAYAPPPTCRACLAGRACPTSTWPSSLASSARGSRRWPPAHGCASARHY